MAYCTALWDPEQELYEPLRAILADAAGCFPQLPSPLLRLLTIFGCVLGGQPLLPQMMKCPHLGGFSLPAGTLV